MICRGPQISLDLLLCEKSRISHMIVSSYIESKTVLLFRRWRQSTPYNTMLCTVPPLFEIRVSIFIGSCRKGYGCGTLVKVALRSDDYQVSKSRENATMRLVHASQTSSKGHSDFCQSSEHQRTSAVNNKSTINISLQLWRWLDPSLKQRIARCFPQVSATRYTHSSRLN